eukprot:943477-Pyramimonas_sp.AAC.1
MSVSDNTGVLFTLFVGVSRGLPMAAGAESGRRRSSRTGAPPPAAAAAHLGMRDDAAAARATSSSAASVSGTGSQSIVAPS